MLFSIFLLAPFSFTALFSFLLHPFYVALFPPLCFKYIHEQLEILNVRITANHYLFYLTNSTFCSCFAFFPRFLGLLVIKLLLKSIFYYYNFLILNIFKLIFLILKLLFLFFLVLILNCFCIFYKNYIFFYF